MNILSVDLARTVWLFPTADLNPRGLNLHPYISSALVESYKFLNFPPLNEIPDPNKGMKYENGEFINEEGKTLWVNFTVYSEGLVADTRSSTKDSEYFIKEVLSRLSKEFKVPHYESINIIKQYLSQLNVTTEKSLELINPKLNNISKYLTNNVSGHGEINFEMGGISFWADQTKRFIPPQFVFERSLNIPFSENRYYSRAALDTDQHINLLGMLEEILSS